MAAKKCDRFLLPMNCLLKNGQLSSCTLHMSSTINPNKHGSQSGPLGVTSSGGNGLPSSTSSHTVTTLAQEGACLAPGVHQSLAFLLGVFST